MIQVWCLLGLCPQRPIAPPHLARRQNQTRKGSGHTHLASGTAAEAWPSKARMCPTLSAGRVRLAVQDEEDPDRCSSPSAGPEAWLSFLPCCGQRRRRVPGPAVAGGPEGPDSWPRSLHLDCGGCRHGSEHPLSTPGVRGEMGGMVLL